MVKVADFEWDERKAAENVRNHDISFEQAIPVFGDPLAIVRYDDREDYGEDRFVHIGISYGEILRVIYTVRKENLIRIISASRATASERKDYQSQTSC
jgi:uncharacterized protein